LLLQGTFPGAARSDVAPAGRLPRLLYLSASSLGLLAQQHVLIHLSLFSLAVPPALHSRLQRHPCQLSRQGRFPGVLFGRHRRHPLARGRASKDHQGSARKSNRSRSRSLPRARTMPAALLTWYAPLRDLSSWLADLTLGNTWLRRPQASPRRGKHRCWRPRDHGRATLRCDLDRTISLPGRWSVQ
jgi:hypothetical protein